jgi:hypothetical protein
MTRYAALKSPLDEGEGYTYRTCPAKPTMSVDGGKADLALVRVGAFLFAPLAAPTPSVDIDLNAIVAGYRQRSHI